MTEGVTEARHAAQAAMADDVMVEGFVLIACATNSNGERVWTIRTDPDQSLFVTLGLTHLAKAFLAEHVDVNLGYDRD